MPRDTYDSDSLAHLAGLDAIRKRPSMYIGGTGSDGLRHLVWELIDNSVDEASAGFATKIDVVFYNDGSVEVADNGRGIPVSIHKDSGKSGLELVLTELHAGGKFGDNAYKTSSGLHGVGITVVNALSTKVIAEVDRDGNTYSLEFNHGEPKSKLKKVAISGSAQAKKHTGTRIRFWPDRTIFHEEAVIDPDLVCNRARQMCYLVPGLTISVQKSEKEKPQVFSSEKGLTDFLDVLAEESGSQPICDAIRFSGTSPYQETIPVLDNQTGKMVSKTVDRECQVDIACQWNAGWDSKILGFANTIFTPNNGVHVTGFESALLRSINDALRSQKVLKQREDNVIGDDVEEGLVAIVRVILPEPQFEGQTKGALGNSDIRKIVYAQTKEAISAWLTAGNKRQVKTVLDKIATASRTRIASRTKRDTARSKATEGTMPAKLSDCHSHGPDSELLIVEGDSAAGYAIKARNAEYQAILPLRGKPLNVESSDTAKMLSNKEWASVITAIGAGYGRNFDVGLSRYGRIIIMADADVDGSHIRCLLLTFFHKYMSDLLVKGMIYAAVPPLYSVKIGNNAPIYSYTEAERDRDIAKGGKNVIVSRFKGLGEMDEDELALTTLESETRKLHRITFQDAEKATQLFNILMGSASEPRKEFIFSSSAMFDLERLSV